MPDKRIRTLTEKLWAKNKYTVMAKGYEHYQKVGEALKNAQSLEELVDVYDLISESLTLPFTKKGMRTTLQHMWGYFKKQATSEEKEDFFIKLNLRITPSSPLTDQDIESIRSHLAVLLKKYPSDYLLQSSFVQTSRKWNEVYDQKQLKTISRIDYSE
ncbi:YbgA family protein [Anaerobacillus sp. 1_MG-2023]|uniref:YbgA family protein n=1 Tax=Anaerobacillus sp. 1_MG-2023 TaxID=3062655 RepID=UPI0026E3DADC|nr:YbgA family protein [Anaerobacillus sp. 1_MG-2023]MDO6656253.1 YbgA family protein [Anaerobacillus sp. 1_MG-2023]